MSLKYSGALNYNNIIFRYICVTSTFIPMMINSKTLHTLLHSEIKPENSCKAACAIAALMKLQNLFPKVNADVS